MYRKKDSDSDSVVLSKRWSKSNFRHTAKSPLNCVVAQKYRLIVKHRDFCVCVCVCVRSKFIHIIKCIKTGKAQMKSFRSSRSQLEPRKQLCICVLARWSGEAVFSLKHKIY